MSKSLKKKVIKLNPYDLIITSTTVLFIVALIGTPFIKRLNEDTVQITIIEKEVKNSSETSKYLIFTDDEVYEISDTIAYWRWNSSDLYGNLKVGKTYECKVCSWRIPFLSMYRNIITADEVPTQFEN